MVLGATLKWRGTFQMTWQLFSNPLAVRSKRPTPTYDFFKTLSITILLYKYGCIQNNWIQNNSFFIIPHKKTRRTPKELDLDVEIVSTKCWKNYFVVTRTMDLNLIGNFLMTCNVCFVCWYVKCWELFWASIIHAYLMKQNKCATCNYTFKRIFD